MNKNYCELGNLKALAGPLLRKNDLHLEVYICGEYNEYFLTSSLLKEETCVPDNIVGIVKTFKHIDFEWIFHQYPIGVQLENIQKVIKDVNIKIIKENGEENENNVLIIFVNSLSVPIIQDIFHELEKTFEIPHLYPQLIFVFQNDSSDVMEDQLKNFPNFNKDFIYCINKSDSEFQNKLYKNLLQICSYYNELGDILRIETPKDDTLKQMQNGPNKEIYLMDELLLINCYINIMFIGQFNSGKSTLINRLLGKTRCRMGKGTKRTKRIVRYHLEGYPICLIDTPGYDNDDDIKILGNIIGKVNDNNYDLIYRIHALVLTMNANQRIRREEMALIKNVYQKSFKPKFYFIGTKSKSIEFGDEFKNVIKLELKRTFGKNYLPKKGIEMTNIDTELEKQLIIKPDNPFEDIIFSVNLIRDLDTNEEIFGVKGFLKRLKSDFNNEIIDIERVEDLEENKFQDFESINELKKSFFFQNVKNVSEAKSYIRMISLFSIFVFSICSTLSSYQSKIVFFCDLFLMLEIISFLYWCLLGYSYTIMSQIIIFIFAVFASFVDNYICFGIEINEILKKCFLFIFTMIVGLLAVFIYERNIPKINYKTKVINLIKDLNKGIEGISQLKGSESENNPE